MRITIRERVRNKKPVVISMRDFDKWRIEGLDDVKLNDKEKEAFYFIQGIFKLESILGYGEYKGKSSKFENPEVKIEMEYLEEQKVNKLEAALRALFSFSNHLDVPFKVITTHKTSMNSLDDDIKGHGKVCLFSGGVDSTAGIIQAALNEETGPVYGLYVSYNSAGGAVNKVANGLMEWGLKGLKGIYTLRIKKGAGGDVQQVRGFIFTSLGVLLASKLGLNSVIVSEIGPVMYQPFFNVLDEVTVTTHPFTIDLSKSIMRLLIDKSISVDVPFSDKTKSEVVHELLSYSTVSREKVVDVLKKTRSCRHSMWANHPVHPHCGNCLGCVIRRSAFLLNGIEDENSRDYKEDAWGLRKRELKGDFENYSFKGNVLKNIYPLLEFSANILDKEESNDDFPMGYAKIRDFEKEEVYERYALEILSTLFLIYDAKNTGGNEILRDFYLRLKESRKVNLEQLKQVISHFSNNIDTSANDSPQRHIQ